MNWNRLFENVCGEDESDSCQSLYSMLNDSGTFYPPMYPSDPLCTLQHPSPPNEPLLLSQESFPLSWSDQAQDNVTPPTRILLLPDLPSHNSMCPLVNKLEPLRCLFIDNWVRECEKKGQCPF